MRKKFQKAQYAIMVECPACKDLLGKPTIGLCTDCYDKAAKCPFKLGPTCYERVCFLCGNTEKVSPELAAAYALLPNIPDQKFPRTCFAKHHVIYYLYSTTTLLSAKARELVEEFLIKPGEKGGG